jgi:hypothetical protein
MQVLVHPLENTRPQTVPANPSVFFLLTNAHNLDDTTPVRQRRVTGLAVEGARSFRFLEGSEVGVLSVPWPAN